MLLGAVWAAPASAANTRVPIFDFAWHPNVVEIDLGEKVTWDWLGPDLAHSVTGVSANAAGWDSDPDTDAPSHQPGDTFTVQFDQPGVYLFQCKLHSAVRGEVIVSSTPGDPSSDPGPQAPINIDVKKPTLGGVRLARKRTKGKKGIGFRANVSERGTLDGEYYRFNSKGKRRYSGYRVWSSFIGVNNLKVGARWKHFKAKPGRYEVVLRAIDEANNVSKPVHKRFRILG
ncbi:MAG: plastocyanin/azurin family copper-binding protein [Solirubrobacterales bacterium]